MLRFTSILEKLRFCSFRKQCFQPTSHSYPSYSCSQIFPANFWDAVW